MKKVLFIILFLLNLTGHSQEELNYSNHKFSVGFNTFFIFNYGPYVSYQFGKHQLGGGVFFGKYYDLRMTESPGSFGYSLTSETRQVWNGTQLHYRLFPFAPQKNVSFFLENLLTHRIVKNTLNGELYQNINTLSESINAGLQLKFLKRFSFHLCVGPAINYSFTKRRYWPNNFGNDHDLLKVFGPLQLKLNLYAGLQIGLF